LQHQPRGLHYCGVRLNGYHARRHDILSFHDRLHVFDELFISLLGDNPLIQIKEFAIT
jgi:hypothetical protein